MAVELWIDDGNPWYLSPNIWVVPSDDPNDPPGVPYANVSAYVWARVRNSGSTAVSNAQVRFYWADPSTVITPTTATLIGTSAATLAAGETKDVLCVTPWTPVWVNDGHECLIAQAFAPADPLPPQGPNDPFNVPADRHTAQRNITLGAMTAQMKHFIHAFTIGNDRRFRGKEVTLRVRRAEVGLLKPLLRTLGLKALPDEAPEIGAFGLTRYRCGQPIEDVGRPEVTVPLEPGRRDGLALIVEAKRPLPAGVGALMLVEQSVGDVVVGGLAVLIVPEEPRVR